ncbi:uncharacterized protein THITE_2125062 [Thermothielavioides terrestris NRRL 8126]|uniref:Uncharacterized protein n=1 Tax=Thermothielavioides terrestris (strain ATCC 38088 / NRRL 8126) TaxID=578455 RepID=G2QXR6_THETT|nr:uncharacterized protein THITE_2125062 [Thermothielavioides terrestris NRRL 8126]AEO62384.1 hypothetical protein THITE_2125062 [Thermothielavioides terrestris NRRL 8126]
MYSAKKDSRQRSDVHVGVVYHAGHILRWQRGGSTVPGDVSAEPAGPGGPGDFRSSVNAGAYCLALVPHLIISPAISIHRSPAAIEHRAVDDWMLNRTVLDPEWRLPARRFRQAAPNRMEWTVPEHHQILGELNAASNSTFRRPADLCLLRMTAA